MKKSKLLSSSSTQWVPSFIYWNLRLLSKRWNIHQNQIIQESVIAWINKNKFKTQDYFLENKDELIDLTIRYGESKFRDKTLADIDLKTISVNKLTSLNLKVASLQAQKPMSGILTQAIIDQLESINWIMLSQTTAKEQCLREDAIIITGELVDGQEAEESEDIFTKLWNKLEAKGLLQERKKYTYDDLLAIQSQSEQEVELSPEAAESFEKIKSLLGKKEGDQE